MSLSVTEVIERIHRIDSDLAALQTERVTLYRILEREALRQEEKDRARERQEADDWTAAYAGQAGKILSAIWHAPFKRLSTTRICMVGWNDGGVIHDTFLKAVKRIRRQLKQDRCRYCLTAIKSRKTKTVKGYGLRKVRGQRGQK